MVNLLHTTVTLTVTLTVTVFPVTSDASKALAAALPANDPRKGDAQSRLSSLGFSGVMIRPVHSAEQYIIRSNGDLPGALLVHRLKKGSSLQTTATLAFITLAFISRCLYTSWLSSYPISFLCPTCSSKTQDRP